MADNIIQFRRGVGIAATAMKEIADEIIAEGDRETVLLVRIREGHRRITVYELGPELTPLERVGAAYSALALFDSKAYDIDP